MINVTKTISLDEFEGWCGADETLDTLYNHGDIKTVERMIIDLFGDTIDETKLNDLLRFEQDWIAESLGYLSWDEYAKA